MMNIVIYRQKSYDFHSSRFQKIIGLNSGVAKLDLLRRSGNVNALKNYCVIVFNCKISDISYLYSNISYIYVPFSS